MTRGDMFSVVHALVGLMLAAGIAMPTAAAAEPLPPLDKIMTAEEKQLFTDAVVTQLESYGVGQVRKISVLNDMLARDPEPTQFRGYLQLLRAEMLLDASKNAEAIQAVDESVRLLPSYSAPLLEAFSVYTYSRRPGDGADFLLRASQIDPEAVKSVGDYDLNNLLYGLNANREAKRLEAVATKLLEIGWTGKQIDGRSKLAAYAIEGRVKEGDVAGARALIPELLLPSATYNLLADNRFRALWPALETWAGKRLERQWPIYLDEARARYVASGNTEHVIAYLSALDTAGLDDLIISDALPLFQRKIDPNSDQDLIVVTFTLGDALSRAGRWDDLRSMFAKAEEAWPLDLGPDTLNLFANHARFLLSADRPEESVTLMDQAIDRAKKWGVAVNSDAIASMYLYRACALHRLGRDADAGPSITAAMTLTDVDHLVTLNLCLGSEAGARNVLIKALQSENLRSAVIALLQLPSHPPCKSTFCTDMKQLRTKLRSDPAVLSELGKHGRILPFRVNETARFGTKPTPQAERIGRITA